jgi:hypothetical protein
VGTSRIYNNSGVQINETITAISMPPGGPYFETHTLGFLTFPTFGNLSLYADFDGTAVSQTCDGKASAFNLTIGYCATNATFAGGLFHSIHLSNVQNVAKLLGGNNFTTCEALGAAATTTSAMPIATGAAGRTKAGAGLVFALGLGAAALL